MEQSLIVACERYACTAPVYTLMPDHLHVLLVGQKEEARLDSAFVAFKRLSGTVFRNIGLDSRWQASYYDHVVRGDWAEQVRYILRNPYRAGLISSEEIWPYSGSIGHDLHEIAWDAAQ